MRLSTHALLLLTLVLFAAGCSDGEDQTSAALPQVQSTEPPSNPVPPPPPPPPPPPAADVPDGNPPAASGDEPDEPPEGPPAPVIQPHVSSAESRPAPPSAPVEQPASSEQPEIRLSTGIALPQTTPVGTVMSFSVDYRFTRGQPDASVPYVWVIERDGGPAGKWMVPLKPKGTLQMLVEKWRARDGPFRCHVEDRQGHKLSGSLALH